jgi:hypothetical protein
MHIAVPGRFSATYRAKKKWKWGKELKTANGGRELAYWTATSQKDENIGKTHYICAYLCMCVIRMSLQTKGLCGIPFGYLGFQLILKPGFTIDAIVFFSKSVLFVMN